MPISQSAWKSPEAFNGAQLIASDFDGTTAQTFEKSPSGVDVNEAYVRAIDELFGPSTVDYYLANGGLSNQAPLEIVSSLVPGPEDTEIDLMPLVEELTRAKLAILMGEIGTRFDDGSIWPRPTNGYLRFLEELETARTEGRPIDSLILSSGHEPFISKVYEAWGVEQPDYVVATERLKYLNLSRYFKPSPILMDAALQTWAEVYGVDIETALSPEARRRVVYVGDDDAKDGQMARDSGVEFFLVNSDTAGDLWPKISIRLGLARAAFNGDQMCGE